MKNTTSINPKTGVKVVASLLAASQVASAASAADSAENVESLEPTTVVATKFEKSLSDVSASVAVLDVDQLNSEGNVSLQDAIGYRIPGVIAQSTTGQRGQTSNLWFRGMPNKYAQVRVDGTKLTAGNGEFILNYLGVADLNANSEIELLKGPSSSLYGSGAAGGVLSLSLAKGEGAPSAEVMLESGSFNSVVAKLSAQGQIDRFAYHVGVSEEDTDNDSSNVIDDNHFNQFSFFGRFDYSLTDTSSIGATVRSGNARYATPEYGNPLLNRSQFSQYDYLFTTLFYTNQLSDKWRTKFTAGLNKDDYDGDGYVFNGMGAIAPSHSATNFERYSFIWDNEYAWSDVNTTTAGAYYERSKFTASWGANDKRRNRGVYVNHSSQVTEILNLSGSVSVEDHKRYGEEISWSAGATVDLTDSTRIKFNSGSAFLAPSSGQLNSVGGDGLEGERSFSWDATLEQNIGGSVASITWFETDVDNKIINDGTAVWPTPATYENSDEKEKASGLEFSLKVPVVALKSNVYASYTYLDRKLSDVIAAQSASCGVDTVINENLNIGTRLTWVDGRDTDYLPQHLGDYLLVGAYANYTVTEKVKLHLRVDNLFDENYEIFAYDPADAYGPGSPAPSLGRGRGFYGGVTVSF